MRAPLFLTPYFHVALELYVYITLTNNYLAFFIYKLIMLWTISINWHRWLLVNNHIFKYNSFILVLYRRYINVCLCAPPPPPPHTHKLFGTSCATRLYWFSIERLLLESWSRPLWKWPLSHLDGSWRRQTGINCSISAALVCNNLPLQMLIIPCRSSLPSWRTLQKKLFLRLRQYQNVSINHGFLTFAKMQSKSATGPLRGSQRYPTQ